MWDCRSSARESWSPCLRPSMPARFRNEPAARPRYWSRIMCRNIKTLANFEPPATEDEIRASALQFVRKLSGASKPSRANEETFNRAVDEVTAAAHRLVHSLTTHAPPRNREIEAA